MTTEVRSRRDTARAREDAAPTLTPEMVIGMEQTEAIPGAVQAVAPSLPANPDGPPDVEVKNAGSMKLFKKLSYGWKPVIVPKGSVNACIESGAFRLVCGDCGRTDCGLDPNSCTGREALANMRCPVCRKRMYDTAVQDVDDEDLAEGEIRDESYHQSTPLQRLRVKLDNHIVQFHPAYAQERGLLTAQSLQVIPAQVVVAQAPAPQAAG